jgi:hypothetical protein
MYSEVYSVMAHFAELDENNKVLRVIVVNNSDILDSEGNESEDIGKQFCINLLGGKWIQTSYNSSFRKNFAGIGSFYDENRDAFIPEKVFNSWVLNEETCLWESPLPRPDDNKKYDWNDDEMNWVERA